ncbi:hypothetical protein [Rhizobium sp.]
MTTHDVSASYDDAAQIRSGNVARREKLVNVVPDNLQGAGPPWRAQG